MVARWSLATIALGLFGIGCLGGGDPPPVPEDELPVVTLTPTRQDLTVPEDAVLVAEARYADGSLATGGHFQWSTGALPPLRREPPLEESPLEEGRSQATLRSPGTRGYLQVLVRWEVCDENGDHCRFTDQALSVVTDFTYDAEGDVRSRAAARDSARGRPEARPRAAPSRLSRRVCRERRATSGRSQRWRGR